MDLKKNSQAGFDNCVGCIDGILIWINKPNKHDLEVTRIGHSKFFCGQKSKFGLNMQATCDAKRRFLEVDIQHPGATSDYLAFETSYLNGKLKEHNFLHPNLAIYGDCAYVNTPYLAAYTI
jgi:DDE superfamily endonuclease